MRLRQIECKHAILTGKSWKDSFEACKFIEVLPATSTKVVSKIAVSLKLSLMDAPFPLKNSPIETHYHYEFVTITKRLKNTELLNNVKLKHELKHDITWKFYAHILTT